MAAGRTVEVLVEGPNPRDPSQAMGRTRHNKLCFFPGNGAELKAKLVNVKVEAIRAYTLSGSIVS
jgi:tRNA-2-methylthio-N6-dimethylallyladenosine synthase